MKKLLTQALKQLQTEQRVDAAVLSAYVSNKLSQSKKEELETLLAISPESRKELVYIKQIIANYPIDSENNQSALYIWLWRKIPVFSFVLVVSLFLGYFWQMQNKFEYMGLSDQQFSALPQSTKASIESIIHNQMPQQLFNQVTTTNEIVRAQNKTSIEMQYPTWSRVEKINKLTWTSNKESRFTVYLIDENDNLIVQFNPNQINSNVTEYWVSLNTVDLCNQCQYAWRVLNVDTYEATDFIPFEVVAFSEQQSIELLSLPEGMARLSYYWHNGYLHQALLELDNIKDNSDNKEIKQEIKYGINKSMRR